MARSRRRRRSTTRKPPPPWVWLAVGLLAGLFVAFLVFLQLQPQADGARTARAPQTLTIPDPQPEPAPATRKKRPEPAAPPPPRFDFYNLLPEMEVIVPDEEIQGSTSREGVRQVEQPGTYLLQAGSFRSRKQADQLRARLALLGLETNIQSITVDDRQAWHRVRVGPFSNLSDLNQARTLLKKQGIDAILIRLKG